LIPRSLSDIFILIFSDSDKKYWQALFIYVPLFDLAITIKQNSGKAVLWPLNKLLASASKKNRAGCQFYS